MEYGGSVHAFYLSGHTVVDLDFRVRNGYDFFIIFVACVGRN